MQNKKINSNGYWDSRFLVDWESFQGPMQSRFFARLVIEKLPNWLMSQLRRNSLTLCDWGCAQGDGTDVWANYMASERITGVDFSSVAIEQAAQRYPTIKFINEDWLNTSSDNRSFFDVVFSSNTLEHFHRPYDVLENICGHATKALVLAIPYRELDRHQEHFYTFLPENIPSVIGGKFRLVWSKVVNCRKIVNTYWSGEQIILVYANSSWIDDIGLTLDDCRIEADDFSDEIKKLKYLEMQSDKLIVRIANNLSDRSAQIAGLKQEVADRDSQLAILKQEIADRDGQLASLNHAISACDKKIGILEYELGQKSEQINSGKLYIEDKEIYIAILKDRLERINSRFDKKMLQKISRLKRLPYYARRSVEIIKAKGLLGFLSVVIFHIHNQGSVNDRAAFNSSISNLPASLNLNADESASPENLWRPLLDDDLIIVTGVPFDDVGGGQRAAQLARCALKTGRRVIFLYIYKKFDFELNHHVESAVVVPGLIHKFIGATSPAEVLKFVSPNATLLLELPHSETLPYLQLFNLRGMTTVFELIDDWESSLGGDWFNLQIYHQIVREAKFVVGTAKVLVNKLRELGRYDVVYLPNAANEYIFDKYKKYERPIDLPNRSRRIALYFGSLYGDWFGWDYIVSAAQENRDMDFVLIGDKPSEKSLPPLPANVIFLGGKKIDELPAYLAYSDIGLLPFSPGKISDAVSPIKIFEYLFSGVPVVATRLPEIEDYPGVLIACSTDEFASLCKGRESSADFKEMNDRFIYQNSWFSRLENIAFMGREIEFRKLTSVIILIHNNSNIIGRCLDSLFLHCAEYLHEVIVVDNASSDGGADFVEREFPSVKVIRNSANGCSSGRNLGVQNASGKYLAFFDSDQWFTSSSCFKEALSILSRDANVGAVGWAAGWFEAGRDDLGGMIADYCQNRAMNDAAIRHGYRSDIGYLGTGGFFLPKSVFDSTDGFDVAYDPTCFEDTDVSFQIKKLGFEVCYRDLTGIRHQPHQTTMASAGSDDYQKLFRRNAKYFMEKWSNFPQFFLDYNNLS